jgi:hypothetical protein
LELKRYLTVDATFETDWRSFDSFSLDFDLDPATGVIEFGQIRAFDSADPSGPMFALDFFGEISNSTGVDLASLYPIGGTVTEGGVQRPLIPSDSNAFFGFFNGANGESSGHNFAFSLDLEFDSGSSEETLRVAGLDVASALFSGASTVKGSEQLPSFGFTETSLLAFPLIAPVPNSQEFSRFAFEDPATQTLSAGLAPGVNGVALGVGSSLAGLADEAPTSGLDLRGSFVLRMPAETAHSAIDFRGGKGSSTNQRYLALDDVGWGLWNSLPGAPVRAFDNPENPAQGPVIPGYALYAGGISPSAPIASGQYELSYFGNSEGVSAAPFNTDGAPILIQRTGTEGAGLNNLSFFSYSFNLDFSTGAITNGFIDIHYTSPRAAPEACCNFETEIFWHNRFQGSLAPGSAVPSLELTQLNLCVRGFCIDSVDSSDLDRNRLGGVFSGPDGNAFWGALSLEGTIPAGTPQSFSSSIDQNTPTLDASIIESLQVLLRAPCISGCSQ